MSTMDIERFRTLAEIHGSDFRRWPAADRETARALAGAPGAFAEILADAARLDEALDGWTTPAPASALRERVLAGAPTPRKIASRRLTFWLSSAGVATVGLVGVLCGMTVSTVALSDARDEALVVSAMTDSPADDGRPAPRVEGRRQSS